MAGERISVFQSTPARERATSDQRTGGPAEFQSTPARERATEGMHHWILSGMSFNPRPRVSGRPGLTVPSCAMSGFNPRPRVSGRPNSLRHSASE